MADVTKVWSFLTPVNAEKGKDLVKIDREAKNYEVSKPFKGLAVIFNHYKYDGVSHTREGTLKDSQDLQTILELINFKVAAYLDLRYGEILEVLNKVSTSDLSSFDCLVVAVMTHGGTNYLRSKDQKYLPETIWNAFAANKCQTLIGKPKIFLIQSCRGNRRDSGIVVRAIPTDSEKEPTFKIPSMADILIMYSTYDDHCSFRNDSGSFFFQAVVNELHERWEKEDLMGILTSASRRMAVCHEENQIGMIVSTLTKKLYFVPQ